MPPRSSIYQPIQKRIAAIVGAFMLALVAIQPLYAVTEPVTLKQIKVDDIVYLPTVRSQRVLTFTKPKTWQLSGASYLQVVYQHSLELLPESSWLEVLVNDKPVYHVALGRDNAKATVVKIPMPIGILKDYNTLTFRVEQHYLARCEDPLDPSLWTQILPESKLVFEYSPVLPEIDLAKYPYPIIDPLTYSPERLKFVLPDQPTEKELQALGYLNMHLAQAAGTKETRTFVGKAGEPITGKEHLIYIGTPQDNPALAQYQGLIASKQLSGDSGLLLYMSHPTFKDRGILVVTGNTAEGVLQAAKYITTRPMDANLKGLSLVVPETWNPNGNQSAKVPRYVENQTRTLAQLGYGVEAVEKINAPPIVYQIPVLAEYKKSSARLYLDLVYSYGSQDGSKINPLFSSLEIRMNDVPIGNIPLQNIENGESMARATVPIPKDLILPSTNKLVAQFHLMPDKYGFCTGSYDDKAWGKIHDDSKIRVDGTPGSLLPDVGILNYTGFPYSRDDNFKNTHFMLPKTLTPSALHAFLGMTSRLGRATLADTDLRFTVSQGDEIPYKSKDLVIIEDLKNPVKIPDGNQLSWLFDNPLLRQFNITFPGQSQVHKTVIYENGAGAYLEQFSAPWNQQQVVTVVGSRDDRGFEDIAQLLEVDELFAQLTPGPIKQLMRIDGAESEHLMNTVIAEPTRTEQQGGAKNSGGGWFDWFLQLPWLWIIGIGLGLIILFGLLGRIFGRKRYRY